MANIDKKTGSDGSFRCETMSQIRFRVGDLIIGEIESVPNDGYVFPQDLVGVSRTGNFNRPRGYRSGSTATISR